MMRKFPILEQAYSHLYHKLITQWGETQALSQNTHDSFQPLKLPDFLQFEDNTKFTAEGAAQISTRSTSLSLCSPYRACVWKEKLLPPTNKGEQSRNL